MNEKYFEKLRNLYLAAGLGGEDYSEKTDKMLALYARIIDFAKIARKKGLLDLEEVALALKDCGCEQYLKSLIQAVVDGTDPDKVEEVGLTSVFSSDFDSFDSIICLMCLRGTLLIQGGENPYTIGIILRSFFPSLVLQTYQDRLQKNIENRRKVLINKMDEMKKKCDESYYSVPYRVRLSEYISQLSDEEVEHAYYSTNTSEWARALWALEGCAIMRIIGSLDIDMAEGLIEEADHFSSIRLPFAEEACEHIYKQLVYVSERD